MTPVPNGTVDVSGIGQVATGEIPQLMPGRGETSHVEPGRAEFPHVSASWETWGDSPRQPSNLDSSTGENDSPGHLSPDTTGVSNDTVPRVEAGGGESPSATPQRVEGLIVVTYCKQGRRIG